MCTTQRSRSKSNAVRTVRRIMPERWTYRYTHTYNMQMFDPVTLAVGAAIAGAGWATGRFSRRKKPADSPAPCGCGHDLALHDPQDGVCHADTGRKNSHGLREWVRCGCRRYTGPLPIEDYFTRPILPSP
jgi:hypothetical protein